MSVTTVEGVVSRPDPEVRPARQSYPAKYKLEILAELERRLGNDDDTERAEVVDNLRQIALLRLEQAV